ncbi:hypothetical protein KCP71_11150 [Salmonella enterica subsp. enterica]|nr:hypothetical protein KCP71_11150 [Salmonella enterica subsp. enterica]
MNGSNGATNRFGVGVVAPAAAIGGAAIFRCDGPPCRRDVDIGKLRH